MASLQELVAAVDELNDWVQGIYQLEQEDLVLGGADGIDNLQAKQLLARCNWLKTQVLGLGAGKQPLDGMLTALSALVTEADQTLYFTGPDAPALTALTAYARTLIAAADAAAARATLGAASPADIAAAIAALVNSSPATLDTLNELAAALGNDANFATTITNALALKAPWTVIDEVIAGAGITVDHGVVTQLRDAILALSTKEQHGQAYLSKSGANLLLAPKNGNKIIIGGVQQTIPAAGVQLAPTGLTPGTIYFIYAYMNAGVMTLEASITGHSVNASNGVEIKTGDASRTLVGQAWCTSGPSWIDGGASIGVLSWFNRKRKTVRNPYTANRSTASTSYVELSTEIRTYFIAWADQTIEAVAQGGMSVTGAGPGYAALAIDGLMQYPTGAGLNVLGGQVPWSSDYSGVCAEAMLHYSTIIAVVASGGMLTLVGNNTPQDGGQRVNNEITVMG